MGSFRAFGFVAVTLPAVALAHSVVSGSLPPALLMVLVAAGALLAGWSTGHCGPRVMVAALAGAQLVGHGVLYVGSGESSSGCLPAIGRGARVGLDLALLRPASACGPDGYAAGASAYAAVAALLLALTLIVGQVLVAAAGTLALRAVEISWAVARSLGRSVALVVIRPVQLAPVVPAAPVLLFLPVRQSPTARPLLRRGPPAFVR